MTAQPTGSKLIDLVTVMDQLRSPGGCPWDAEQTHQSLVEYLIEETYETVDAIEVGHAADLREELGDVLLQVVFHARIAQEAKEPWSIDDVAAGITEKLISRHPHVFADGQVEDALDSERQWQLNKAKEKGRASVTDGIPASLPGPVLAAKTLRRAARGGIEVDAARPHALAIADDAMDRLTSDDRASEFGDVLLALIDRASSAGIDADAALRGAIRDLNERILRAEDRA
ncbi:MAG: XTP/dITP diphosphohydrolase [Actinomycetes bacterium]|jgi:XTP/dITP diphosphohydrolase